MAQTFYHVTAPILDLEISDEHILESEEDDFDLKSNLTGQKDELSFVSDAFLFINPFEISAENLLASKVENISNHINHSIMGQSSPSSSSSLLSKYIMTAVVLTCSQDYD